MSMSVVDAEVRRYVEAVRAHLADLAPDDRAELLEDLEAHLLEVAAEDDGTLEQRLGPPDAYAEELRVSAGIEPHSEPAVGLVGRIRQSEISASIRAIAESAQGRAVREFFHQIAPGWWVARGYLLVLLAALLYARSTGTPVRENFPIPFTAGSYPIAIVLIPAAIWASWMLGRRGRQHRAWRSVSIAATLVLVGAALTIADDIRTTGSYGYVGDEIYQESQTYLHHADGSAIANICPYSSDGTLLSGVLLFDQGGRAIINTADDRAGGYGIQRQRPAILNAYPLAISAHDESGQPTPVLCPASVAAQPNLSSPVSPTPIPTPGD